MKEGTLAWIFTAHTFYSVPSSLPRSLASPSPLSVLANAFVAVSRESDVNAPPTEKTMATSSPSSAGAPPAPTAAATCSECASLQRELLRERKLRMIAESKMVPGWGMHAADMEKGSGEVAVALRAQREMLIQEFPRMRIPGYPETMDEMQHRIAMQQIEIENLTKDLENAKHTEENLKLDLTIVKGDLQRHIEASTARQASLEKDKRSYHHILRLFALKTMLTRTRTRLANMRILKRLNKLTIACQALEHMYHGHIEPASAESVAVRTVAKAKAVEELYTSRANPEKMAARLENEVAELEPLLAHMQDSILQLHSTVNSFFSRNITLTKELDSTRLDLERAVAIIHKLKEQLAAAQQVGVVSRQPTFFFFVEKRHKYNTHAHRHTHAHFDPFDV